MLPKRSAVAAFFVYSHLASDVKSKTPIGLHMTWRVRVSRLSSDFVYIPSISTRHALASEFVCMLLLVGTLERLDVHLRVLRASQARC